MADDDDMPAPPAELSMIVLACALTDMFRAKLLAKFRDQPDDFDVLSTWIGGAAPGRVCRLRRDQILRAAAARIACEVPELKPYTVSKMLARAMERSAAAQPLRGAPFDRLPPMELRNLEAMFRDMSAWAPRRRARSWVMTTRQIWTVIR